MTDDHDLLDELDLGGPSKEPRRDTVEHSDRARLRLVGAPQRSTFVEYGRDLTVADLEALSSQPRGVKPRSLVRIHASHHALAKCLAVGMKRDHAALVTGYSPVRVSQLQNDEAFMALVADYRMESKAVVADQTERMNNMSLHALEILQDLMHDNPEQFTPSMLLDMIKAFADRTGHGPGQEVKITLPNDFIDRPPRESYDEWQERRNREVKELN